MRKLILLIPLLLLLVISEDAFSQRKSRVSKRFKKSSKKASSFSGAKPTPYFGIGGSLNTLNYYGDITPKSSFASSDIRFTRPGIGVYGEYSFGGRFKVGASFLYGRLQADDNTSQDINDPNARFRYVRNLHFRNDIKELTLTGTFDFIENYGTFVNRFILTPYISTGITIFHHNPQARVPDANYVTDRNNPTPFENAGEWIQLRPLGTEGQWLSSEKREIYREVYNRQLPQPYSTIQIAIPINVGVRYKLTNNLDLCFEIGYRQLFFDHLDDVSSGYVDLTIFDDYENVDPDLARAMSYRSNEPISAFTGNEVTIPDGAVSSLPSERFQGYEGDPYSFDVYRGYGNDFRPPDELNLRGSPTDNDIYLVTSFKLTYILGGSFRNAKFR